MAKAKTGRTGGSKPSTQEQLKIIRDAGKRKLGRRAILEESPREGFIVGGVAAALQHLKKPGGAERHKRKRQTPARTAAKVAKVEHLVGEQPSLSLKDLGGQVGLK